MCCTIRRIGTPNRRICIINLIKDLLENQLKCCVTRRGALCGKIACNKVVVNDKLLGFCNLKTCQKELVGSYTKKQIKKYKKINANHVSLAILGSSIYHGLLALKNLDNLDYVLIENQPVLKNPKMKSIQMIIYSFFMFMGETPKSSHKTLLFNPSTKLKVYDGPAIESNIKNKYAMRKFLSVEYTKYFLNKTANTNWIKFFNDNPKKDDLADSYLQALTYHYKYLKS